MGGGTEVGSRLLSCADMMQGLTSWSGRCRCRTVVKQLGGALLWGQRCPENSREVFPISLKKFTIYHFTSVMIRVLSSILARPYIH